MKLYTIGFTQKSAEEFFGLLSDNGIQRVVDIRINPSGQLSGFAKQSDLPFFLTELVSGCQYRYFPELAPTKEILVDYRKDNDWPRYVAHFEALMDERIIPETLNISEFESLVSCLLCSEPIPDHCHRRLVAERIAKYWEGVEIVHL